MVSVSLIGLDGNLRSFVRQSGLCWSRKRLRCEVVLTRGTLGDALLRSPGGQLLDVGVPSGFAVGAFGWMLVENRNS